MAERPIIKAEPRTVFGKGYARRLRRERRPVQTRVVLVRTATGERREFDRIRRAAFAAGVVLGGYLFSGLGIAIVAAKVAAGFGIANEKRWESEGMTWGDPVWLWWGDNDGVVLTS